MIVIVLAGIAFAVLAMFAIFLVMFIDVAFKLPHASVHRQHPGHAESPALSAFAGTPVHPHAAVMEMTSVAGSTSGRARPEVAAFETDFKVSSRLLWSRHTRHVRVLIFLITVGGASALFVRSQLVPKAFGDRGPYRAAALEQIAAQPSRLSSDSACLKCHSKVQEERAESPHKAVRCMHCHGNGHEHIAAAIQAAVTPGHVIPPAGEWDGDFHSKMDLFITQDRATCLSCHTSVVGMPSSFRSIDMAKHLEEQGAENVSDRNVCFECHTGHSPGI